jgi:hypothetical protein
MRISFETNRTTLDRFVFDRLPPGMMGTMAVSRCSPSHRDTANIAHNLVLESEPTPPQCRGLDDSFNPTDSK